MARLDLTPDVITQLQEARRFLDELKNRQFAGADNLLITTNQSGDTYDYSAALSGLAAIPVQFDADTQENAFTELRLVAGTNPSSLSPDIYQPLACVIQEHVRDPAFPKRTTWTVYYSPLSPATYYFKFYVLSTDSGTVS